MAETPTMTIAPTLLDEPRIHREPVTAGQIGQKAKELEQLKANYAAAQEAFETASTNRSLAERRLNDCRRELQNLHADFIK